MTFEGAYRAVTTALTVTLAAISIMFPVKRLKKPLTLPDNKYFSAAQVDIHKVT